MNAAAEIYMSTTSNKYLKQLQEISNERGENNVLDISAAISNVLTHPNTVFFSDMAYFVLQIMPPSGIGIGEAKSIVKGEL
jgi:hypothetical protein